MLFCPSKECVGYTGMKLSLLATLQCAHCQIYVFPCQSCQKLNQIQSPSDSISSCNSCGFISVKSIQLRQALNLPDLNSKDLLIFQRPRIATSVSNSTGITPPSTKRKRVETPEIGPIMGENEVEWRQKCFEKHGNFTTTHLKMLMALDQIDSISHQIQTFLDAKTELIEMKAAFHQSKAAYESFLQDNTSPVVATYLDSKYQHLKQQFFQATECHWRLQSEINRILRDLYAQVDLFQSVDTVLIPLSRSRFQEQEQEEMLNKTERQSKIELWRRLSLSIAFMC